MRLVIIFLLFLSIGCKQSESKTELKIEPVIITDPALLPDGAIAIIDDIPICESGDHSCRTPFESSIANETECATLDARQPGDTEMYYFDIGSKPNHLRIDSNGVYYSVYDEDDESWSDVEIIGRQGFVNYNSDSEACQISINNGEVSHTYWYPNNE